MKTNIKCLMLVSLIGIDGIFRNASGQSTSLGNVRAANRFLGWVNTSGTSGTLEIQNDWSDHINFSTATVQRMTILGNNTATGTTAGNVGIGTVAPWTNLHIGDGSSFIKITWMQNGIYQDVSGTEN